MRPPRLAPLLFAPALLACASARPAATTSAPSAEARALVDRELAAVYDRFVDAYRRADPEPFRDIYADSAFYLQPSGEIMRGEAAIMGVFGGMLNPIRERGAPGPNLSFEIVDRDVRGDLAYDIGYFRFDGRRSGKFIVVWKRESDGRWRMWADGYSNVSAPRRAP